MRPQFFLSQTVIDDLHVQSDRSSSVLVSSSTLKGLIADLATLKLRLLRYDAVLASLLPGVDPNDFDKAVEQLRVTVNQACDWPKEIKARHWETDEMLEVRYDDETGNWEIVGPLGEMES